jgi:hypothetical protein
VSAVQGIGVGLLFTPLATLAFSTLAAELRTDAAGVYNLLRQLGCAAGVALMTALLRARIATGYGRLVHNAPFGGGARLPPFETATFFAYTSCFRTMAVIATMTIPGILLFRAWRRQNPGQPTARHDGIRDDQARDDQARDDQARHHKARHHKARDDQARDDEARDDQARDDEARHHKGLIRPGKGSPKPGPRKPRIHRA